MKRIKFTCISLVLACLSGTAISGQSDSKEAQEIFYSAPFAKQVQELRKKITQKDFEGITNFLSACTNAKQLDARTENRCVSLYQDSINQTEELRAVAKNWFEKDRNNYHAAMFYANNIVQAAWVHRGHSFSKYISTYRRDEFNRMLLNAISVAKYAYKLRPDLPYSYNLIINSYGKLKGDKYDSNKIDWIVLAEQKVPNSYNIIKSDLHSSQPRWGGSYKEMQRIRDNFFARSEDQMTREMVDNYILLIKANDFRDDMIDSDIQLGISIYKELLDREFEQADIHTKLASLFVNSEVKKSHIEKALKFDPYSERTLHAVQGLTKNKLEPAYVAERYEHYLKEFPTSYRTWLYYAYFLELQKDYAKSKLAMQRALELEPYQPLPQEYIAMLDERLGLNPREFDKHWYKEMIAYAYPRNDFYERVEQDIEKGVAHLDESTQLQHFLKIRKFFGIEPVRKRLLANLEKEQFAQEELEVLFTFFADFSRINYLYKNNGKEARYASYKKPEIKKLIQRVDEIFQKTIGEINSEYQSSFNAS